jgi:hypothetical protein
LSTSRFQLKRAGVCATLVCVAALGLRWAFYQPDSTLETHSQMLALLQDIQQRTPLENPTMGDLQIKQTALQLANLPADGLLDRFKLNWSLGKQQLVLGRIDDALLSMEAANEILPTALDQQLLYSETEEEFWFSLAIAYLRAGETKNCVHCNNGERCILPIRNAGIHEDMSFSRTAIGYLTMLLDRKPDHHSARWLLNIAYMTLGEHPDQVPEGLLIPLEAFESEEPFPRFRDIARTLDINTFSMCGGSIVDDFDNDGFLDIVNSGWSPSEQVRFYHNDGNGSFTDRTEQSGLTGIFGGLNLIQADYDNDGDIDVFVLRGAWLESVGRHPNSLLQNDGRGNFRDVTFSAGLGKVHYPTQTASWGDYDNDGDLDLYVGNESFPCQLFRNEGDGTFTDVAAQAGVINDRHAKGVIWGDYNNDRWPDLYVSNFKGQNRLYHNNGDGTFTDRAMSLGVTAPHWSFPTWFWDYNNDGNLDLFVGSYLVGVTHIAGDYLGIPGRSEADCLYEGNGQGGFREVAALRNLHRVTQPMGSNFGDLDHDGFLDFYLGTGYPEYEGLMPNLMFHNHGGERFNDVTTAGGFGHLQKGHGVSFADLDNDGDQDIYIEMGGAYPGDSFGNVFFSNPGFDNHWICIRLVGTRSNRSAIGARMRLDIREEGTERSVYKWVNSGGSFGANPLRQQIGVGKATRIELLEIYWPASDTTQYFKNLDVDQFIQIEEEADHVEKLAWKTLSFQASNNGSTSTQD